MKNCPGLIIVPSAIVKVFFRIVVEAICQPPISTSSLVGLKISTHSEIVFESSPGGLISISLITT